MLKEIHGPKRREVKGNGNNYELASIVVHTPTHMLVLVV